MSRIITEIAEEILGLQDGGVDNVEDIEATVRLVLRGVYKSGYVIAPEFHEVRTQQVINFAELED